MPSETTDTFFDICGSCGHNPHAPDCPYIKAGWPQKGPWLADAGITDTERLDFIASTITGLKYRDDRQTLRVALKDRTRTETIALLANALSEKEDVNPALVHERLRAILTGEDFTNSQAASGRVVAAIMKVINALTPWTTCCTMATTSPRCVRYICVICYST